VTGAFSIMGAPGGSGGHWRVNWLLSIGGNVSGRWHSKIRGLEHPSRGGYAPCSTRRAWSPYPGVMLSYQGPEIGRTPVQTSHWGTWSGFVREGSIFILREPARSGIGLARRDEAGGAAV